MQPGGLLQLSRTEVNLRSAAADLHNMSSRDAHDVHKALMMATDSPKDAIVFNLSKGLLIDFTLSGAVQHWMRGNAVLWQSRLRQALLTTSCSSTSYICHLIRRPCCSWLCFTGHLYE